MTIVLCGTPAGHCQGSKRKVSQGLQNFVMSHAGHREAFRCHRRYLLSRGYTAIGSRELRPPAGSEDTYIRVLTKQTRFGAALRPGKEGKRSMPPGRRGGVAVCM